MAERMEPSPERTKVIMLAQVVVIVVVIVIWSMSKCRKQMS
jgi:hypothetical protein